MGEHTVSFTTSFALNSKEYGTLIGTKGELTGKYIRFKEDQKLIIGRDNSKCDVVISDRRVSGVHCEIRYNLLEKKYEVKDLSSNGIKVNGDYRLRKNQTESLAPGSKLWLGSAENEIILG